MQNHWLFSTNYIYFCKWQKADDKEDAQNLEERNSARRRLFAVRKQNIS